MASITGAGRTTPGQGWQKYADGPGIYLDVNTAGAGFNAAFETPAYTISLGGNQSMWYLAGSSSVYSPTLTGFRVYLRNLELDSDPLTVQQAAAWGLHINWIGVQTF
jgi:hypothetical protein